MVSIGRIVKRVDSYCDFSGLVDGVKVWRRIIEEFCCLIIVYGWLIVGKVGLIWFD